MAVRIDNEAGEQDLPIVTGTRPVEAVDRGCRRTPDARGRRGGGGPRVENSEGLPALRGHCGGSRPDEVFRDDTSEPRWAGATAAHPAGGLATPDRAAPRDESDLRGV